MHVPYFILLDALCLDLDLVLHAIGVHLEVFLVLICNPGVTSTTSKYTSAV